MSADNNGMREFKLLCEAAMTACDREDSTQDFEGEFVAVLEFIKSHPDKYDGFKKSLIIAVDGFGPESKNWWELIPFLMADLKWPEVYEAAKAKFDQSESWGLKDSMTDIMDAYEPLWENGDMYSYYSK